MPEARQFRLLSVLLTLALAATLGLTLTPKKALAATNQLKGVNWADQRDNFVNGVLYPSGLSSSDTYSSASAVANRVVGQLYSLTGANTVRMPINEPTVANGWSMYTGAIDEALTKGNVILAFWAYNHKGVPVSWSAFYAMWDKVIAKYGSNSRAYFEPINEPGMGAADLDNFYATWLNRYTSVPRGRVILDGSSVGKYAGPVGDDSRLDNTLISVHDYEFYESSPSTSESHWASQLAGLVGKYASRTVMTEFGSPMSSGYDYSQPSSSNAFIAYLRGVTDELRTLGMGSVYWPGLRDGDGYSMTKRSGSGSAISLSVTSASGLGRLQYGWGGTSGGGGGGGGGGTGYVRIQNHATGLYIDGMGRTTNGSNAGQYASSTSTNQQWAIVADGSYVRIQNRATGLFLDGEGRTTNGSAVGQWSNSTSNNQQWLEVTVGSYVKLQNRATGLYIDGAGLKTNGSDLDQWSNSTSNNQQWTLVAAS